MKIPAPALAVLASLVVVATADAEDRYITLSNIPLGTREKPLVLRTYFPDPGLGRETLSHHALGARARKYSPGTGDVEGFVDPIPGIPAAIGVNFGPDLSICWDTTECRLLYAWQGGFLDMTNYWGTPESGRRRGFDYLPELMGQLVYVTKGSHPLAIFDTYTQDLKPVYHGYRMVGGVPEFSYSLGETRVRVRIEPGEAPMSIAKHYIIEGAKEWDYHETGYSFKKTKIENGTFSVIIQGKASTSTGPAAAEASYSTKEANAAWGEALYTQLGCFACHSTDGTRGHGPSFRGVYGSKRPITGQGEVLADDAYIAESIANPMAKVVETFPAGYMPPYPIDKLQVESITLFLKTLVNE